MLLQNANLLVEILSNNRKRRNKNFVNASTMELVYQFEQNLIKLGGSLQVSSIASTNAEGNFLETLRKISQRKKVTKKD
jgi:hypothetical protein